MAMYCPQCNTSRPATLACTVCGGQLVAGTPRTAPGLVGEWMQMPLARVVIGLILAQGLFHALRQFATGIFLASFGDEGLETFNTSLRGVVFWQILQGVALFVGAGIAGSGDLYGFLYGAMVGVGNGLLTSLLGDVNGSNATLMAQYGQPLIQAALGVVGGWLGSSIYRPLPEVAVPSTHPNTRKEGKRRGKPWLHGPTRWGRVLIGVAIAVAGTLSAGAIFDTVLEAGRGRLATQSYFQDQLFTWEIKILALLLGGALAGANTPNGFKQGLLVGVIAAMLLAILPRHNSSAMDVLVLFLVSLSLSIAGGWFGGQLLPPLLQARRPKHIGPMA